jgi:hypothetical protein
MPATSPGADRAVAPWWGAIVSSKNLLLGGAMGWIVHPPGTLQRITDNDFNEFRRSDVTWPRVFMTGDGHRTPAFRWTEACLSVNEFFRSELANNRLYAYVEVRPADVTADHVPGFLAALKDQGHIIGWELPVFEQLQPSMHASLEVKALEIRLQHLDGLSPVLVPFDELITAVPEVLGTNRLIDEATFGHVNTIIECLDKYFGRQRHSRAEFTAEVADTLKNTALNYFNSCMGLRSSASYHRAVGTEIQRNILQAPASTHLIACGDNHLICADPLQQFIGLDVARALGWVDAAHG